VKQLLGSRGACPLKMSDGATASFSRLCRRPASRSAFINTAFETPLAHSMPTNRRSEPGMAVVFLEGRPSTISPASTQARRSHRAQQAPRRRSTLAFVKFSSRLLTASPILDSTDPAQVLIGIFAGRQPKAFGHFWTHSGHRRSRRIGQPEGSKDPALKNWDRMIFSDAAISTKAGLPETLQHMVVRCLRAELRGEPLSV